MTNSPTIDQIGGADSIIGDGTEAADLTITGTTDAGTTVALTFGAEPPVAATVNVSGTTWSHTLLGPDITALGQGLGKTITATATAAGITSDPTTSAPFGVETVPPAPPTINEPIGGSDHVVSSQTGDAEVTGTTAVGSSVTLAFDGNALGAATVDISGKNWAYALTGGNLITLGLESSGRTITATAADAGGNLRLDHLRPVRR